MQTSASRPQIRPGAKTQAIREGVTVTSHSEPDSAQEVLRETIRHEENLINTRLTWMLTFQGFLFAATSLATDQSRTAILDVVPWVGILVSGLSFLGVAAAYGTIDAARKTCAGAAFGGVSWRKAFGRTNSLGIPVVIVIAWLALYLKLP
jgi:hypothetical protein